MNMSLIIYVKGIQISVIWSIKYIVIFFFWLALEHFLVILRDPFSNFWFILGLLPLVCRVYNRECSKNRYKIWPEVQRQRLWWRKSIPVNQNFVIVTIFKTRWRLFKVQLWVNKDCCINWNRYFSKRSVKWFTKHKWFWERWSCIFVWAPENTV